MMAKTMRDITKQYMKLIKAAGLQDKKKKSIIPEDNMVQAKFYLEQHEYNYKQAIESFKKDLKGEIQVYEHNKHLKKYFKKKEKKD